MARTTRGGGFQVAYVTACHLDAVRAFRSAPLDYLLKPLDTVDLIAAVKRAETATQIQSQQPDNLSPDYGPGQSDTRATQATLEWPSRQRYGGRRSESNYVL